MSYLKTLAQYYYSMLQYMYFDPLIFSALDVRNDVKGGYGLSLEIRNYECSSVYPQNVRITHQLGKFCMFLF
jgi:hypothetical protein